MRKFALLAILLSILFTGCEKVKSIEPDYYSDGKLLIQAIKIDESNSFITTWEWRVMEGMKVDRYNYIEGLGEYKLFVLKDATGKGEVTEYSDVKMTEIKRQGGKILSFKVNNITFKNDKEPTRR